MINKHSLWAQKNTLHKKCAVLQTKVKQREVKISHEHPEEDEKIEFNDGEL